MPFISAGYDDISIDNPEPIIIDRTTELDEWKSKIDSQKLPEIADVCNKFMIPNILCPWGCNEFIFKSGFISIDIMFQRFLRKASLTMIHNVTAMQYISYCRNDYIRFTGDYDCLLLNPNWKVMPSVCLRSPHGVQVMTCKDHDGGSKQCMIHPPRQPKHNLASKYSDQMCHAVIKPRTVTTTKAQQYSNTYQMHEQKGNFNGIDTCSVTQFRNFKLLSYLLQVNIINGIIFQLIEISYHSFFLLLLKNRKMN